MNSLQRLTNTWHDALCDMFGARANFNPNWLCSKGMLNYGLALLRGSGGVKAKDLQGVRPLLDLLLFVKGGLSRSFGVGAEVCSVVTLAFADQHSAGLV